VRSVHALTALLVVVAALAIGAFIACSDDARVSASPGTTRAALAARVAAPTLSPEVRADNPRLAPTSVTKSRSTLACAPTGGCLVVWETSWGIYGERVVSDGTRLDPVGIPILVGRSAQVAFDGTNYLVAAIVPNGLTNAPAPLYAVRVRAADGVVLDRPFAGGGIAVASAATNDVVVFDGTNFVVAWDGGDGFVHAGRVRPTDGALLDGPPSAGGVKLFFRDPNGSPGPFTVAFDGRDVLFVWQPITVSPNNQVVAARVRSSDLTLLDGTSQSPGFTVSAPGHQELALAAFDGTNFVVAWQVTANTGSYSAAIYAARVRPDGTVLDGSGGAGPVLVRSVTGSPSLTVDGIASDGTNDMVVWNDPDGTVCARRFRTADLSPLDGGASTCAIDVAGPAPGNLTATSVQAAFDGQSYVIAYADPRTAYYGGAKISGTRVRPSDGVLLDGDSITAGLVFAYTAEQELGPRAACGTTTCLMAWLASPFDGNPGVDGSLRAARIRQSDGTMLDPAGIDLGATTMLPSVAFDGTNYAIAWGDAPGIRVARVREADGALLDGPGVLLQSASGGSDPMIAFDGTRYVVAWAINPVPPSTSLIRATRVLPSDLSELDPSGIDVAADYQTSLVATSAGAGVALVVWRDQRSAGEYIEAARIRTSDGTVLDSPDGGSLVLDGYIGSWGDLGGAAFDGTNFFVVSAPRYYQVFGYRVRAADGVVLDGPATDGGIPIALTGGSPSPHVAFDGQNFVAAWQMTGSGAVPPTGVLRMGRVAPDGTLLDNLAADGGGIPVIDTTDDLQSPFVASASGKTLVTYSRHDVLSPFEALRARGRFFGQAQSCASPSDCSSGFCVDGVCCNSACGGGVPDDCLGCSLAAGASVDGTCGPVAAGQVCRAATDACALPATCDGVSTACPANPTAPAGTPCRGASAACDVAASCTGSSTACPPPSFLDAGTACRAPFNTCQVTALCGGTEPVCPANPPQPDGTPCGDAGVCAMGICTTVVGGGPGDGGTDAPAADASGDAAAVDAGSPQDAGAADANVQDAAAPPDASEAADAAPRDASVVDAAERDATADAPSDASVVVAGGGCGCRTSSGSPSPRWPLLVGLVAGAVWQRRRKRAPR
jgi:MYXO-CTERM domain-containing protein